MCFQTTAVSSCLFNKAQQDEVVSQQVRNKFLRNNISMSVTIIMPVKNSGKYIRETLESIADQQGVDYQLLAYDNGSTDGTLEILNDWIPRRIPGRVISDCPTSYPASLAKLVLRSNTEYIARLDSDDVMANNRLIRQVEFLNANPEVGLLGTGMLTMDSDSKITGIYGWDPVPTDHSSILLSMLAFQPPIAHPSVMMRRDVVLKAGNYRDIHAVEDLDLWLRISKVSTIAVLNENLTVYRQHSDSVTAGVVADRTLETRGHAVIADNALAFGLEPAKMSSILSREAYLGVRDVMSIWKATRLPVFASKHQLYSLFIALKGFLGPRDYLLRTLVVVICWNGCNRFILQKIKNALF